MDFYKNLLNNERLKYIKKSQEVLHKEMIKQVKTYFNVANDVYNSLVFVLYASAASISVVNEPK